MLVPSMTERTERETLLRRYSGRFVPPPLGYGTVRDYCDSCDYLPSLSSAQNDLKDLQRPWTVKAALGLLPQGARLLEIGAGQPLVAAFLAELGYAVTVVDPYDGSAGGPREFETFTKLYPKVRILQGRFESDLPELCGEIFDGIYSVSVLEHIPEPALGALFQAISSHLPPGGKSFHSIDCVSEGNDAGYHFDQCFRISSYQCDMAGGLLKREELGELLTHARADIETYYLSAAGHNLWRGGLPYDRFPFRKVLSLQTAVSRSE
jgi:SAM-dependent methyltransferase